MTGIISRLCGLTKSRRKCIILCLARIAVFDEETTSRHAFLFSYIQNLLPERSPNPLPIKEGLRFILANLH